MSVLIVFDGVDGCGKSTQLQACRQWLESLGRGVTACQDPGSTPLGQQLRRLLLDHSDTPIGPRAEMLMFMAARAQLVEQVIQPALYQGRIVLCDRFSLSTVVYQGHAGEIEPQSIWQINEIATGGLEPELTMVFDVPIQVAMDRLGPTPDRLEGRGRDFLDRVRRAFLVEAERRPSRVAVVDASGPIERVQEEVRRLVTNALEAA